MKNFSITIMGLIAVLSTMFVSCSQQEEIIDVEDISTKGEVVYNLHMDCSAPTYDEEKTTRATTSWAEGSVVYLIFKNGVTGTATYNNGKWMLKASSSLGTASDQKCTAAYVENPISVGGQTVEMNEGSVLYKGEGTYSVAYSDIYVKVALSPETWRLRFKGNKGTKISLPGNKNDIVYNNYIQFSSLLTSGTGTDVSLTVNSNNYTDYIHGEFVNKNGNNTLYIINETEGVEYYRENISGNMLSAGKGGYLTIPTRDTYASLGWEIVEGVDPNAYVRPKDMVTFTDGIVTSWELGSTVSKFYCNVIRGNADFSDEEIIELMLKSNYNTREDADGYIFGFWGDDFYTDNTSYILCTIAYNESGKLGELVKTPFTTKSASLPSVVISNVKATTANNEDKWSLNLSFINNASKYYIKWWEGEDYYDINEHYLGYWLEMDIREGGLKTYNYQGATFTRTENCVAIGAIGVDAKGNIGNFSCVKATTSSNSRAKNAESYSSNGVAPIVQESSKCKKMFDKVQTSKLKPHFHVGIDNIQ